MLIFRVTVRCGKATKNIHINTDLSYHQHLSPKSVSTYLMIQIQFQPNQYENMRCEVGNIIENLTYEGFLLQNYHCRLPTNATEVSCSHVVRLNPLDNSPEIQCSSILISQTRLMQKAIDLFLNIYFGQKNKYNFLKMWGRCVQLKRHQRTYVVCLSDRICSQFGKHFLHWLQTYV